MPSACLEAPLVQSGLVEHGAQLLRLTLRRIEPGPSHLVADQVTTYVIGASLFLCAHHPCKENKRVATPCPLLLSADHPQVRRIRLALDVELYYYYCFCYFSALI